MSSCVSVVLLFSCLIHGVVSWGGFYTTEYQKYTLTEQTISVVFTLEAPFKIVKHAPLSLTTVLDSSGSMRGKGIDLLKGTTQFLVHKLGGWNGLHDVGVVAYDSTVEELSGLIPATMSNAEHLSYLIDSIKASGKTFLSAGLDVGIQQQARAPYGKVKSVYLFSDGRPTIGPRSIGEVLRVVDRILESTDEYISISTFGVGDQIDYSLLAAIAERGGGELYMIRRPEDIPFAFGKALGGLTTIVGTEIELYFTTYPGCRIKSVNTGGIYAASSTTVKYDNLYAGEFRDILFEVELGVGPIGFEQCLKTEYYYVDAVTRERLSGGSFVLEIERSYSIPDFYIPASRVEENKLKYITADACIVAKAKLLEGDTVGAVKALAEAKQSVVDSVLKESSALSALLYDINALIGDVESDDESPVLKIGKIGNLITVLGKQRSVTTEADAFESDKIVETEEQKLLKIETEESVFDVLGIEKEDESGTEVVGSEDVEEEVASRPEFKPIGKKEETQEEQDPVFFSSSPTTMSATTKPPRKEPVEETKVDFGGFSEEDFTKLPVSTEATGQSTPTREEPEKRSEEVEELHQMFSSSPEFSFVIPSSIDPPAIEGFTDQTRP